MEYIDLTKTDEDITKLANLNDSRLKYIYSIRTNDDFEFSNKPNYICQYTTKDSPFSLEKSIFDSALHINYDYFQENFKEIIDKVCVILKGLVINDISLDKEFITKETMEAIVVNQNIHRVILGLNYKYRLEKDLYDILSKSDVIEEITTFDVDSELNDNYDSRLAARMNKNIGNSNVSIKHILNSNSFTIDSRDLLEVLEVIKHRNKELPLDTIIINITDYNDLKTFINYIVSIYKDVKIIFNLDFKNFNTDLLSDLTEYKNIVVKEDGHEITLDLAIKKELKIRELLEPVETIKNELSPFEIYTKLYKITKEFKPYNEVEKGDDLDKSRTLSKLLFNEYIVCAGYANLLQELCKRYNIDTYYMFVDVIQKNSKTVNDTAGHARLLVKMEDDKYGIDGLYVSDPTWDSNDFSRYNHILMTFDEIRRELKGEITFNAYDFLNVKNKEEFYALANNPAAKSKLSYLPLNIKDFDEDSFERICRVSTFHYDYNLNNANSLEKMADYCVNFHQEVISGNDILKALITIYKLENPDLEDNQIIEYFKKIKDCLKEKEESRHPTIVMESEDEKIFDFYDNKYNDVNIEELVTNKRKNTR